MTRMRNWMAGFQIRKGRLPAAQAVAEQRFTPEMLAPITAASDEIGRLAQAFVQMAEAFEAQEAELAGQVEELRGKLGERPTTNRNIAR